MPRKKPETGTPETTVQTTVKKSPSKRASAAAKPATPRKPRTKSPAAAESAALPPIHRATLPVVTLDMRHSMIAEAAYYIAEKRGQAAGDPAQDWYEAEAEIDQMLEGMLAG
jgi:hypothetical protein